ncbi:hypothetical protein ACEPPN_010656 [Leptodophora sp. 'Broadleaf-Isolate-01']
MPNSTAINADVCNKQTSTTTSSATAGQPKENIAENGKENGSVKLDTTGWTEDDYQRMKWTGKPPKKE